ncbi:MAG: Asp-tRNA(Asn)/Glu-tRNA(Gln) amidotransferase subunit GatA [Candidatus Hydrogenedentota bacterium]|nr:MAG: Asp-tRNA(Asn)/Glu-tRNA(Gln) amidotransferase subunit GatA [Candidatus Hydrogenedentota bacterium]
MARDTAAEPFPFLLREIASGLAQGLFSPKEITAHYRERIDRYDGDLGCFLHVAEVSGDTDTSECAPLHGAPIALKDLLVTSDMPTTCASRILEGYRPPYDATAVKRLREAGACFLGKLNMDEFAMGSSNENSAFHPCRNPWDRDRVPGGSSGGSAAAVAARLVPASLGSDTGGSIRQPASFCGVTGLKPTYGRVSRYGLVAFASSLDQIGPLTIDAADAAFLLEILAGHDPLDSTSASVPVPRFTETLDGEINGTRVGIPKEYFSEGLEEDVRERVEEALRLLEGEGADLVEVSLPHTRYAVPVYYIVAPAEASSNLARFDGVRYGLRKEEETMMESFFSTRGAGFGPEVKRRILLGTYALSSGYYDAYYKTALKVRTLIQRDFLEAFRSVDVIATPTSPTPAFRAGERLDDPIKMYLSDVFTISVNLAGLPAISIPCGFVKRGKALEERKNGDAEEEAMQGGADLPVGLQLIGKPFDEAGILRVADAYQRRTDYHLRVPEAFS